MYPLLASCCLVAASTCVAAAQPGTIDQPTPVIRQMGGSWGDLRSDLEEPASGAIPEGSGTLYWTVPDEPDISHVALKIVDGVNHTFVIHVADGSGAVLKEFRAMIGREALDSMTDDGYFDLTQSASPFGATEIEGVTVEVGIFPEWATMVFRIRS